MKVWFAPYSLKIKNKKNTLAANHSHEGALIKIEHADVGVGYADFHPWPELGDMNVNDQLDLAKQRTPSLQFLQTLDFAFTDGVARSTKKSLFAGAQIPPSHFLADIYSLSSDLPALQDKGFTTLKLKIGRNLKDEVSLLNKIDSPLKLRLDFNGTLSFGLFKEFLESLTPRTLAQCQFFEDPFVYNEEQWLQVRVPLALDRKPRLQNYFEGYDYLVVKPAVEDPAFFVSLFENKKKKLVVTNYLDHPVGRAFAAYTASRFSTEECGLLCSGIYEDDAYSERISETGPFFPTVGGTGIGFDDLLTKENWKFLYEN